LQERALAFKDWMRGVAGRRAVVWNGHSFAIGQPTSNTITINLGTAPSSCPIRSTPSRALSMPSKAFSLSKRASIFTCGGPAGDRRSTANWQGRRLALRVRRGDMKVIHLRSGLSGAILAIVLSTAGHADDRGDFSRQSLEAKVEYCKTCHGLSGQGYRGYFPLRFRIRTSHRR
jgi:hypothetical protein